MGNSKPLKNKPNATLYTHKIEIPKFEPNDKFVTLEDCVDFTEYNRKCREIEYYFKKGEISEKTRDILYAGATRFIKHNFSNYAQYYSKYASETEKMLMERQLLVLTDYDKAFENGYIAMREFQDAQAVGFFKDNPETVNYIIDDFINENDG